MRHLLLPTLLGIVALCWACNSPSPEHTHRLAAQPGFDLRYPSAASAFTWQQVQARAQLFGHPSQQRLQLALYLRNESDQMRTIDPTTLEIVSPLGYRKTAQQAEALRLPAHADTVWNLFYEPIADLKTFQRTECRGPLQASYTLQAEQQQIAFAIDTAQRTLLDSLVASQQVLAYRLHSPAPQPEAHVTGNEVLVQGVVINLRFFQRADTLVGLVSVVNHGEQELVLLPERFAVLHHKAVYTPRSVQHQGAAVHRDTMFLPRGGRFRTRMAFVLPQVPDSFVVSTNAVVTHKNQPLLVHQQFVRD